MSAEQNPLAHSIGDMFKVVAFLLLAIAARYSVIHGHSDGTAAPPAHVGSPAESKLPDLKDLSTAGF